MITQVQLKRFNEAAKMIETDGAEAYHSVSQRFGSDLAAALLIAFLRRNLGSMETYPALPEIDEKVSRVLSDYSLVTPS